MARKPRVSLTGKQQEVIDAFKVYNVPAEWFIGEPDANGKVSVIAVGETFVWSFTIEANGEYASSEANFDEDGWKTGIEI